MIVVGMRPKRSVEIVHICFKETLKQNDKQRKQKRTVLSGKQPKQKIITHN